MAHHRAHGRTAEQEIWDHRMRVSQMVSRAVGIGMVLVRGAEGSKGWMLVGKGRGEGELQLGCTVGVREPTWEVEAGQERWRVGIEWTTFA